MRCASTTPDLFKRQLSPAKQKWAIDDRKLGEFANAGGIAGSL
jgi:hypothetical protein